MSKSFLVTGGAGFIGSHLVDRLLERGDRVTVIDNFNDFYDPAIKRVNVKRHHEYDGYRLVVGDIRDASTVLSTLARGDFECVVHLAAMAGVRPSLARPKLYHDVNVMGTLNLLEAMRRYGVRRLIFASSSSVYGNNDKVPFSESDPVDTPISPYAATKRACELTAYTYHHLYDIKAVGLRYFTVYGPRQRPEMAIHKFARQIVDGDELEMYDRGQSQRDYTYIDDIIDGTMRAIELDVGYEIINLGRSDTVTLSDLVAKIEKRIGREARVKPMPSQPGDVERTFADIGKARRLLAFDPQVSIDDGLDRFIDWYLKQRGNS